MDEIPSLPKMPRFKTYYKIKVIILNPGCNIHKDIKPEKLPYKVKIETPIKNGFKEKTYTVKVEDLWKVKYIFLKRPLYWLMGIKGRYLCIFRSKGAGQPVKNVESNATPVLIRNVKRSRILGKALAEIFNVRFQGFGRFMVIIVVTALILGFAYSQGMIG